MNNIKNINIRIILTLSKKWTLWVDKEECYVVNENHVYIFGDLFEKVYFKTKPSYEVKEFSSKAENVHDFGFSEYTRGEHLEILGGY